MTPKAPPPPREPSNRTKKAPQRDPFDVATTISTTSKRKKSVSKAISTLNAKKSRQYVAKGGTQASAIKVDDNDSATDVTDPDASASASEDEDRDEEKDEDGTSQPA
jgi:hypothetical protein